ncbi:MAG: hypothetical protein ACRCZJ_01260 [Erysipelotrichaceae bacterium]
MRELTKNELMETCGCEPISTATLLAYLAISAGIAAIIKILTSSRGKVKIPGIDISWG